MSIRDLTQYYEYKNVNEKMRYLETLNATVSHEMMTPLNCIVAFAERIIVDST
jgi:signal transduction histidine kinase